MSGRDNEADSHAADSEELSGSTGVDRMTEKPNRHIRLAMGMIGPRLRFFRSRGRRLSWAAGLLVLLAATDNAGASDAIVVCPDRFRDALQPWIDHRRSEGLSVTVIGAERDALAMRRTIRAAADNHTRYVMLVGDAPVIGTPCNATSQVPIIYAAARITTAWGSTPTMATDMLYGDFDDDSIPDAVVGRLPVDQPQQLKTLVNRIIAHEQSDDFGVWRGNVQLTGGVGGFGFIADTAIESVTRTVVTNVLPTETRTSVVYASPGHRFFPVGESFTDAVLSRYQQGARFWVYAGHGQVTALDRVPRDASGTPVLDQDSVKRLRRPAGGCPIAVMLACYTGALDASEDSLAEEMLLCEGGPIAVFAGSRMTMPYGNATCTIGLIDGIFRQQLPRLGDAWLSTLQEMQCETNPDPSTARAMIDALAGIISPRGTSLVDERREHMRLYNLIGDPTLKLQHPQSVAMELAPGHEFGQPIQLGVTSPISGALTLSFDLPLGAVAEGDPNHTTVASITTDVQADQVASPIVVLPENVTGPLVVRAIVSGQKCWATAAARTIVRPQTRR